VSKPLEPLVSIVTPTYNHERFIGPCIDSVLSQTDQNWEQIIIDDGSSDGTAAVIRGYSDPRIRYFHQENKGIGALADTYNRALGLSKGELIAILEGDDIWPANKLSELVPAFSDPDVTLGFGEERDIDVDGRAAPRASRTSRKRMKLPRSILCNDPVRSATPYLLSLEGQSFIPPATVIIRRTALESIGGFQRGLGMSPTDVPTFIRLSLQGRFYYTQTVMGFRRRHANSATLQYLQPMSTEPYEFIVRLLESPDLHISTADRRAIEKSWRARSYSWEFSAGRLCLLEERWAQARAHFVRALSLREPRACLGAIAGWLFSWFHADLEGVFERAGRVPLRPNK
jgi:glycosyltransferase involved in cell wall biosynthesis